jgi:ABC-type nitrate/sulfonate/bicarbonate transport system substrate-binding protein
MNKLKIALDWTPNTNHTGFFVALEKGFYKECYLDVEIISPEPDQYTVTPAKKLELGGVDLALASFESVISYNTKANAVPCKAIAAVLQEDLSAIVTLSSSGIDTPRQLDGKRYASYKARYEDEIVRQLIKNDGGEGTLKLSYPEKLGIWNTLLTGQADATWIFVNWEGVLAETAGVELNTFKMSDFGIPYGYSPVIMATKAGINARLDDFQAFLLASKKGFLHAKKYTAESIEILEKVLPEGDKEAINLHKSQLITAGAYGDSNSWGLMQKSRIQSFVDFLRAHGLEKDIESVDDLFTNELLS